MGNFSLSPITKSDTSMTIYWDSLTEQQVLYIKKAYGYLDSNPVPLMAFVMKGFLQEMSDRSTSQYESENSAEVKAAAKMVGDFVPE